jgi:DNA relaxase NicK
MTEIEYRIHWLSFTVHAPKEEAWVIYDILFKDIFGELENTGHGGRGFKEIYHGLLEFKLYLSPAQGDDPYFHFEIPGQACDAISWEYFKALGEILEGNHKGKYSFTRFDFAFDNVPFTPEEVEQAIRDDQLRTLAKRESLSVHASPFAKRDNGEVGTYTVELGSRNSERMIRVYNKRGFTRLEIEMKEKRADVIARQLFRCADVSQWYPLMMSHLRDYVDFHPAWWEEFIQGSWRAWQVISTPKEITEAKLIHWIDHQISPALSVAVDILPEYVIKAILDRGRKRRGARYDLLLNAHQKGD